MSTIGKNISYMRKQLGWTQEELAHKMGYKSKSTINKIELGINDIPQKKLSQFANVLKTTPAHIIGQNDNIHKEKSNCAERISAALKKRNMKQADLCEKTKIPKSAISQYISGAFEPKQDRIRLIANALNVSEVWLMGYDVPMEETKANHLSIPSERIKLLIKQSGKSYQDLEKITGIKKSSLQRYASGVTTKIPLDVIEKLSATFGVSREYLMGWFDEPTNTQKKSPPKDVPLTDGEKMWLDLFRQIPEPYQQTILDVLRIALRNQE